MLGDWDGPGQGVTGKRCRCHRPPCHLLQGQIPAHSHLPLGGTAAERSEMLLGSKCALLVPHQNHTATIRQGTQILSKASFKMQISHEAALPWEAVSGFGSSSLPQPHGKHGHSTGTSWGQVPGSRQLECHCGAAALAVHRPPCPAANSLQGLRPSRKATALLPQCRLFFSLFLRLPKSPSQCPCYPGCRGSKGSISPGHGWVTGPSQWGAKGRTLGPSCPKQDAAPRPLPITWPWAFF